MAQVDEVLLLNDDLWRAHLVIKYVIDGKDWVSITNSKSQTIVTDIS
jgi:hypothetical protein